MLEVKTVAIDVPIFMYKFCFQVGNGAPLVSKFLEFLDSLPFQAIPVFDGAPLPAKLPETMKRADARIRYKKTYESVVTIENFEVEVDREPPPSNRPTRQDYEALKIGLKAKSIHYKTANYEAEALCSYLCRTKVVDAVLTEDSDCLAYLCPLTVFHYGTDTQQVVCINKVLQGLELTPEEFQQLCIYCGNDFNDRIPGIGPVKAYKLLVEKKLQLTDTMKKTQEIFTSVCYQAIDEVGAVSEYLDSPFAAVVYAKK